MTIFWIIVNCVACALFSHAVLYSPVWTAVVRHWSNRAPDNIALGDKLVFALLVILLLVHGGVATVMYICTSAAVTVLTTSLMAFSWAITAYFLLQRFSGPLEQPGMVANNPNIFPSVAFIAFVASTTACVMYGRWFLSCLPIITWLILGYMCAEIAIRRYMRRSDKIDRDLAVFAVNEVQRRRGFMTTKRYPFP